MNIPPRWGRVNDYAAALAAYEAGFALLAQLPPAARARIEADPAQRNSQMLAHYNLACAQAQASAGKHGKAPTTAAPPAAEAEALRSAAFEQLGRAIDLGWHNATHLASDGDLEPLHADPRWPALLERARGAK